MDSEKKGKFAGILADVAGMATKTLQKEMLLSPEEAGRAAGLVLETLREYAGGSAIYLAKGTFLAVTEKHYQIYRRFTGANHAALAREFDLSERQIYNILAAVGEEEFRRRQPPLFETA